MLKTAQKSIQRTSVALPLSTAEGHRLGQTGLALGEVVLNQVPFLYVCMCDPFSKCSQPQGIFSIGISWLWFLPVK